MIGRVGETSAVGADGSRLGAGSTSGAAAISRGPAEFITDSESVQLVTHCDAFILKLGVYFCKILMYVFFKSLIIRVFSIQVCYFVSGGGNVFLTVHASF